MSRSATGCLLNPNKIIRPDLSVNNVLQYTGLTLNKSIERSGNSIVRFAQGSLAPAVAHSYRLDRGMKSPDAHLLIGTWRPIKSEIPDYDLESELLHFTEDGKFLWEHPKFENQPTIAKLKFRIDGDKLYYGTIDGPTHVYFWFEDETLVLKPLHGYKTYWKRIAPGLHPNTSMRDRREAATSGDRHPRT